MIRLSVKRINKITILIAILLFLINLFARGYFIGRFKNVSGGDVYNNLFITQRWAEFENPFTNRRLPFYPLLLLPGHLIDGINPIVWGRVVSTVAGAATCSLIFLIARLFGLGYTAAVFASLLTGFSSPFFYISLRPLSNSLYAFLVVLAVFIFYLPQSRGRKIWLGTILGLASMTRHEGFLVAAVLLFFEIFLFEKKKKLQDRLLPLIPFAVLVLPFFINNLLVYKKIFYSSYLGSEGQIYIPNNLENLKFNFLVLKRSIFGLWFGLNRPIFREMMILVLIIGLFFYIKKHKLGSLPVILVSTSQLFINVFFQPYSRHLQQTIPFFALMVGYGVFAPRLDFKIKTFVRNPPIKYLFSLLLVIFLVFYSKKVVSARIIASNSENKHDYYLTQAILFTKDLEGKIGFAADYPQAVYYLGERGLYFSRKAPVIIDSDTQLNWLMSNDIDYFVWYSEHPYFDLFKQNDIQLFELVEVFGDEDIKIKVYHMKKDNYERN